MTADHEPDGEDHPQAAAIVADLEQELARVGVTFDDDARAQMIAMAPKTERMVSENEMEMGLALNVSGMLAALRSLPNRAGTAAFLAAFRRKQV
jgi:hypothetical protein